MKVKSESKVAQSYPTLSDPMDCCLPGSSTHGIFQERVLECTHYLKQITDAICNKSPTTFFTELVQTVLKFVWNHKRSPIVKAILRKKNKVSAIILSNCKQYFKAIVMKIVYCCHKNRHIDQWDRKGRSEINPHIYGQLMYEKECTGRKRQLFNVVLEILDNLMQGMKLTTTSTIHKCKT